MFGLYCSYFRYRTKCPQEGSVCVVTVGRVFPIVDEAMPLIDPNKTDPNSLKKWEGKSFTRRACVPPNSRMSATRIVRRRFLERKCKFLEIFIGFIFYSSENTTMNATSTCATCAIPSPAIRGDFCRCRTNETWNPAETRKQPSKLQYRFFSFFLRRFLINYFYVFGQFLHEFLQIISKKYF